MSEIDDFNKYYNAVSAIFITTFGLTGNVIVFLVYTKKSFRAVPMFRYYAISVIFETFELLLIWPFNYSDFFQFNKNSISCKTVLYSAYVFTQYVSWIGVVISVDRFISIKYTNEYQTRKKLSFQIIVLASVFLMSSLIYSPYFLFNEIIKTESNETFCGVEDTITSISMDIADFLISALIPFIIMIIFSCITGYYLIKNKRRLNVKKLRKEKRLFKILISMNVFFFLCYFPWSAFVITNDFYTLQNILPDEYYMSIAYDITNFIIFLYCSCSFVVHLICNKKFRSYLLKCLEFKRVGLAQATTNGTFNSCTLNENRN
jgi:hypothetical protein